MLKRCRHRFLAGLLLVCGFVTVPLPAAEPSFFLRNFRQSKLIVSTQERGCILFDVYIAETPDQRSQGLMHIESMTRHEGMLFLYGQDAEISMWMKNTLIPLDMLFIKGTGQIARIQKNTVPMSEEIIQSGTDVRGVLELAGGTSDYYGIKADDRILYPID